MAANLTIYCLEQVTDYLEFERLSHDLMALEGYGSLEPLGGFKDKGRDAVHVARSGRTTIFAYSVREDWRAKLAEDAEKIHRHNHTCNSLVFVTTAAPTAGERDEAVTYIREEFGWELDLFGAERLRILLDVTHPQVKDAHPQIFPPEFLRVQALRESLNTRDHLFVSYSQEDTALAEWLTRKLTAEGYLVWCERFSSLGGESYPDDPVVALKERVCAVVALYSNASLKNHDIVRIRALASGLTAERATVLIPIEVDRIAPEDLDRTVRALEFIPFQRDWADGLRRLLERLETARCPKLIPDGRGVAAAAFLDSDVLTGESEAVYSNCFPVERVPDVIGRFKTDRAVTDDRLERLQYEWSYRAIDARHFLSFHHPPEAFAKEYRAEFKGGALWTDVDDVDGIASRDLAVELLRKSFIVKCQEKGMVYCPEFRLHYFPFGLAERDRLYFTKPDGSRTFVNAAGQRKYWRPSGSEDYRYHLAPSLTLSTEFPGEFMVMVRVRIRLTDVSGVPLPKRKGVSRRKHLCSGWWNDEWFNRMLAVSQFLADDGTIVVGKLPKEQVVVRATPKSIVASAGINEDVLGKLSYERSEILAALEERDSEDETDEEGSNGE